MRYATLFLLCAAAPAMAQLPKFPVLMQTDRSAEPIALRQLTVDSAISGGMAETRVKMVFYNPNQRQLEGNLQFPLADGQQVTGFALDIDGVMRPAVTVDKARGRQVFEEVQRRQVDPGLLEVTQGNNFKLRVYPIGPHQSRTVELTYSEVLQRRGANWVYRLPASFGDARNVTLSVKVNEEAGATGLPTGGALVFEQVAGGFLAHMNGERLPAQGIEVLTLAQGGPRAYRQRLGDTSWFVAEVPVQSVPAPRPAPRVIGLLWDASGSGATRALDAELAELDRYFKALGNVEVRLTRLRDRPEAQQNFTVAGGDWSALRRTLEKTDYDGASALNDWKPQASVDQYLLFSDGLSNYGGKRFPEIAAHQQLFALNSAPSADLGRLAALAERAHGQLIAVDRATPGAAAQALLFQEARVEQITASGAADIELDSHTVRNGMLRVAGRLLAPQAELVLNLTNGGQPQRLVVPIAGDAPRHPNAGATWAGFRLRALEAEFEAQRGEIARIGRRFSIPTRETSLIVLEQLADYVRYEIRPPAKYLAEYKRLLAEGAGQRSQERKDHFEQVLAMFEERKTWWKKPIAPAPLAMPVQPVPALAAQAPPPPPAMQAMQANSMRREAPVALSMAPPAEVIMRPAAAPDVKHKESAGSDKEDARHIGIALKKWVPNAPYMARLRAATAANIYQVYLEQKAANANSSAFYLDAADILLAKGQRDLALRVLSNLAEMDLENRAVLRILGYRLLQADAPALAVPVFEEVLRIAAEEPQSFRDLGLALAAASRRQEAVNTLYEVALRPWAPRFPDIETVALADMNALIATSPEQLDVSRIDKRLLANLPLDLRVVMSWDADNTDIDLYVTDPDQDVCSFSHRETRQGGKMSNDFTGGYGPEEFALRRAKPGKYRIAAHFYGNRQQVLAGATTLQVKLYSKFGTQAQKEQLITLRLKDSSDSVFVGEFTVRR